MQAAFGQVYVDEKLGSFGIFFHKLCFSVLRELLLLKTVSKCVLLNPLTEKPFTLLVTAINTFGFKYGHTWAFTSVQRVVDTWRYSDILAS